LVKKLSLHFPHATIETEEGVSSVLVESPPEKTNKHDLEWFISVFEKALEPKAKKSK